MKETAMACGTRDAPSSMTGLTHRKERRNGTRIAFVVSETGGSAQIISMAADGSNPRRLTNGSAYNWYPDWQARP